MEKNNDNRLEMRSEKVRQLLGTIPPALVRWGIAIIFVIVTVLLAVALCVPYPYGGGESIAAHIFS